MQTPARPITPGSILAAELTALVADAAGRVPADLLARLQETATLAAGLDPYVTRCTSPEPADLQRVAGRTASVDWAAAAGRSTLGLEQEMLSGHVEGVLLGLLVAVTKAVHVLEIGTFTGYATLAMARSLPAVGRVVTCEVDDEVARMARAAFDDSPYGARIDLRVGPARDTFDRLAAEQAVFDLVFLDADKAGYTDYVTRLLDADLLAPHGLLCIDNTLMQGQPWRGPHTPNGTAIAAFNEALAADARLEQVLVPLRDGITLARRTDR